MGFFANFQGIQFNASERKIALGLFLILWIFLFVRAIYVPVLHDEIATFFYYIQSDNYLPPDAHWDANNHVLNSMLSNFSYHLFGSSPMAIRLPNVLSYLFFFYGAFQIAGRINKKLLRWALLLALVASHYMFEYLGECRGYGMSMAFFMMAVYHFIRLREAGKLHSIFLVAFFLFVSTSANLTLIIPSVLFFCMMLLHVLLTHFQSDKKQFFIQSILLIVLGLPFLILVKLSFAFKERGAFYYGGDSGFYDITVRSLSDVYLDAYNTPIAIILTTLFAGMLLFLLISSIRKKSLSFMLQNVGIFPFLLAANIVSILFLFHVLEVNFPEDRVAMHLYILFVTSFAFILDYLGDQKLKLVYGGIALLYIPALFVYHASPTASVFSSEERTSYPIYEYIQNSENDFKFPHLVGGYKTQEFCWYYLNNRSGGNQGKIHTNYHIALDADFQIVRDERMDNPALFDYYDAVVSDPDTKLTLFERKKKLPKKLIYTQAVNPTPGVVEYEYHNVLEMGIDSLVGKTLYIGAEMTLNAAASPFISWLSCTVNDAEGNSLYQEYIPLDWIRKDWKGEENNVLQGTLLHHIPEGAKVIKFYIWNIEQTSFSIPDGKCYLYQLERDFPNQY